MRILHVVTLVDQQCSYGGPLSVALSHCAELQARGHEVTLLAGWRGTGSPPREVDGIPAQLFPVRPVAPGLRYAGLFSWGMVAWLRRHAPEYDVAHVHVARDLVPLSLIPLLRAAGVPYLLQSHGMITADRRRLARAVDAALVRPALRSASSVLSLTRHEDVDLTSISRGAATPVRLRNGVSVPAQSERKQPTAQPDFLFLARLHPRKRVLAFASAAIALLDEGCAATFSIAGIDDGDLPELTALLSSRPDLASKVRYEGPIDRSQSRKRLATADVYVLPSVNEPYPMTVLEALAEGTPVVCTTSCGLAGLVSEHEAGIVIPPTDQALVDAFRSLTNDLELRLRLGKKALSVAASSGSIAAVVDELSALYNHSKREVVPEQHSPLSSESSAPRHTQPWWRSLAIRRYRHTPVPLAPARRFELHMPEGTDSASRSSHDESQTGNIPHQRIPQGPNGPQAQEISGSVPHLTLDLTGNVNHKFLYVGQFIARKNVSSLITAFASQGLTDTLTLVGQGPDESSLQQLAVDLGVATRVHFLGHLDGNDLVRAYHGANTLVLPSTVEVWGLVANEALAAGLHVVLSDQCGAAESLAGMPGVYISGTESSELAWAMSQSRHSWGGPMKDHPITRNTPAEFARIVIDAANRVAH